MDHEPVPDEQHDERAERRGDETSALIGPVPADGLADKGGDEGAGDSQRMVRMKPLGSFGPGETTRAIRPAMKPMMMIQMMFHTTISRDDESTIDPAQRSGA